MTIAKCFALNVNTIRNRKPKVYAKPIQIQSANMF